MSDTAAADLAALLVPLADLMSAAAAADPAARTPCSDWDLAALTRHIAGNTVNFALAAEGGAPDWAAPVDLGEDPVAAFRSASERLNKALTDGAPDQVISMACGELAVHTWDLARALGRDTARLPAGAAERGLTFMRPGLEAHGRGDFFAPEQAAPDDADAYTALAGRAV